MADVKVEEKSASVRVNEPDRKVGLTFGDLCDMVEQGREAGVSRDAVVYGDTWIWKRAPNYEDGHRIRYLRT